MVKHSKGRIGIWLILLFFFSMCFSPAVGKSSEFSRTPFIAPVGVVAVDTAVAPANTTDTIPFYFSTKEQALDTLIAWLLMKKPSMNLGYVSKAEFIKQWRSHDTTTMKQVVEGTWLTYQFKFKKSLLKTQLKMKQSKVNFKMAEVLPRPRITVSVAGDGITKYDYTVKYKKLKYILSFQLWWIDGKGYWVNEVAWSMGV
ncbi:MAG: hypothetical protein RIR98_996 [Bacteroidota bacterium]